MLVNEANPLTRLGVKFREINKEQEAKETSSDPGCQFNILWFNVLMEFRKTEGLGKGILKGWMK